MPPLILAFRRAVAIDHALSTWLGRNTSTRRGAIGTSSPVFGLRPMRCDFWRTGRCRRRTASPSRRWRERPPALPACPRPSGPSSLRDKADRVGTRLRSRSARVSVFDVMARLLARLRSHPNRRRWAISRQHQGMWGLSNLNEIRAAGALPAQQGSAPGEPAPPWPRAAPDRPVLMRPSLTAVTKASGTEAAEVLPCSAMVETTFSGGNAELLRPSRRECADWPDAARTSRYPQS